MKQDTHAPKSASKSAGRKAKVLREDPREKYKGQTILAKGHMLSTDTWETQVNNNLLVLGPSGAGKTRHVLKPDLLQMNSSFIVLDTKGTLHREVGPILAENGYEVQNLNFSDLKLHNEDAVGYNPLRFIRQDENGRPYGQDIISIADALCPVEDFNQPFWDHAAANYLQSYIAYVMEELPEGEQTMASVVKMVQAQVDGSANMLMEELGFTNPDSYAYRLYQMASPTQTAEKMDASIKGIIAEKVRCLSFDAALDLFNCPRQIDFAEMGRRPIALFVTISDVDHSLAPLTNLFVMQAIRELVREADSQPEGQLAQPVRLILDDFSNLRVPDFGKSIAITRSREIWCTILCQTVSQLEAEYGTAGANTIIGNCGVQLILGFQDSKTAQYFSCRANKPASWLFSTPLDCAWLFVSGRPGKMVERFDVADHPLYAESLAACERAEERRALSREEPEEPEESEESEEMSMFLRECDLLAYLLGEDPSCMQDASEDVAEDTSEDAGDDVGEDVEKGTRI